MTRSLFTGKSRWLAGMGLLTSACGGGNSPFESDARVTSDAAIDAPIIGNCEVRFPANAFVQDRLSTAAGFVIGRGALTYATTATQMPDQAGHQPQPAPGEDQAPAIRPANPDGGGVSANCGDERVQGYAWDGHRCRGVSSQYCQRNACTGLAPTLDLCTAANATCEPELCRASGGQWTEVGVSCGTWANGTRPFPECRGGLRAQCICPANQTPVAGRCTASETPLSAAESGCLESGGTLVASCAALICGETLVNCAPPVGGRPDTCDCGPQKTFNTTSNRCEIDASCSNSAQRICTRTGGMWEANACEARTCGVAARNPCTGGQGACNCGALGVFTEDGCKLAPRCRTNACF